MNGVIPSVPPSNAISDVIRTGITIDQVVAGAAGKQISADIDQRVVATADQRVVAGTAVESVIAHAPFERIVARSAIRLDGNRDIDEPQLVVAQAAIKKDLVRHAAVAALQAHALDLVHTGCQFGDGEGFGHVGGDTRPA